MYTRAAPVRLIPSVFCLSFVCESECVSMCICVGCYVCCLETRSSCGSVNDRDQTSSSIRLSVTTSDRQRHVICFRFRRAIETKGKAKQAWNVRQQWQRGVDVSCFVNQRNINGTPPPDRRTEIARGESGLCMLWSEILRTRSQLESFAKTRQRRKFNCYARWCCCCCFRRGIGGDTYTT